MKVIFLKDVSGVGKNDEVRSVADGYARNYLLANKFAELANHENLKQLGIRTLQNEQKNENLKLRTVAVLKNLDGGEHTILVTANPKGVMFAAVGKDEIAKQLGISSNLVELEHPIKELGVYDIGLSYKDNKSKIKLRLQAKGA